MSLFSVTAWPATPSPEDPAVVRMEWYAAVARWAPSKHNTQPWSFVVGEDSLEIWPDPARDPPDADPRLRELVLACGAATELACVAIRAIGHEPEVELLPDGPGGALARLREGGARVVSDADRALCAAIASRRTDRGPLDASGLGTDLPFLLQRAAGAHGVGLRLISSLEDRAAVARLVERADRMQAGRGDVEPQPTPQPTPRPGGAPNSRPGADRPIVGVLWTDGDEPLDWLRAGRGLAAVLLLATNRGASASYLNQPIEQRELRNEVREHLSLGGPPQLILRIGAGGPVLPTPRRSVEDVVVRRGAEDSD